MIEIPILEPEQKEEFDELKTMNGWIHLIEPIKFSIKVKTSSLLNFNFNRDDEGKIKRKSILDYENIQQELVLLKEFLVFLETGGIIEDEGKMSLSKEGEIFE